MPQCLFDRATLLFVGGSMFDQIPHDEATHIQITLATYPDLRTDRWDGATGVRPATGAELAAFDDAQKTAQADLTPNKLLLAAVTYLTARINELRTQPTTAFPALTASDVKNGIITAFKAQS
jgi:hypothetical protein